MDNKVILIDVETSGLSAARDRVVDIGVIYEHEGILVDTFQTYIYLDEYPKSYKYAEAVHGLSPKFLKENGVSEEEGFKLLLKFLDKHINKFDKQDKAVLSGFNIAFDKRFFEALFTRQGNKFIDSYLEHTPYDVLKLARECNKQGIIDTVDNKLVTIAEYLEVNLTEAHSALADIKATREVNKKLNALVEGRKKKGYI